MTLDERQAIVEEIHSEIFAYGYWDDLLEEYEIESITDGILYSDDCDDISPPARGGG